MAKLMLMEEFHVSVMLPGNLPKRTYAGVTRTLNSKRFQTRLRAAIGAVVRRYPSMKNVKLVISR